MSPHRGQEPTPWIGRRTGRRTARSRRPAIEPLESRQVLSSVTEVPIPTINSDPIDIATGSDGALWFTEFEADELGRIDPTTHAITEFPFGGVLNTPVGIAAGPDGNLWFTSEFDDRIGLINPTTHFSLAINIPTPMSDPFAIVAGPDGALWFTEYSGDKIGRVVPTSSQITEFPVPTADSHPQGIAVGPDGNLWFTESTSGKIGKLDLATHQITEFALPGTGAMPVAIVAGPDGGLWFADFSGAIGRIDPTTQAIIETTVPTPGASPDDITVGPDGNLWFTEQDGAKVGSINPATHAITETDLAARSEPQAIVPGPDGNLWFAESGSDKLAIVTPPLRLVATAGPPASIEIGAAFGLTVTVKYESGAVDTGFDGNVTVALADPQGAHLGGTLTVAAHDGVATFSGLSIDRAGSFPITVSTDPTTVATTAPVAVAAPPTITAETVLFAGKGRHRQIVGYELDFSTAMDPDRAASAANYTLTEFRRRGRQLIARPTGVRAAYDATAHRVTLTLAGRPAFARGGELVVVAAAPGGLADAAGTPLDSGGKGTPGDDATFVISRKGSKITR
jgi:virginiamycin B lyase